MGYHFARDTGIATYHNFAAEGAVHHLFAQGCIGRYALGDVNGVKGVAGAAANRSAKTGDGFNKCHSMLEFMGLRSKGSARRVKNKIKTESFLLCRSEPPLAGYK